jgi:hypothetical protein
MLMARSGHTSVQSLAKYAGVSAEALQRHQAERALSARVPAGVFVTFMAGPFLSTAGWVRALPGGVSAGRADLDDGEVLLRGHADKPGARTAHARGTHGRPAKTRHAPVDC